MIDLNHIPLDINAELIMNWLPEGSYSVRLQGQHKRNAYNDLVEIEPRPDNSYIFHLGRNSLYNALPEYMFHPLDRFSNLPAYEEKERFDREMELQTQEIENALKFFQPLDLQLLLYRMMVRDKANHITECDSVLIGIIADNLSDSQKSNRFVKRTLPFLPLCRYIRGDKTLLTQMIRKVMIDEDMKVTPREESSVWTDNDPLYAESIGEELGETYLGNVYDEEIIALDIDYWPDTIDSSFPHLLEEIEEYRKFLEDFFISVESRITFRLCNEEDEIVLDGEEPYNYLNYNTNI